MPQEQMINEELVSFEVARLAKEKGFDEPTLYAYDEESRRLARMRYCVKRNSRTEGLITLAAPTQSLLQRWLREERGIIVEVFMDDDSNMPLTYNIHQYKDFNWECVCHHHGNYYAVTDWELCLEDALKYALERLI